MSNQSSSIPILTGEGNQIELQSKKQDTQMPCDVIIRCCWYNLPPQSSWFDLEEQLLRAEGAVGMNGNPLRHPHFPTVLNIKKKKKKGRGEGERSLKESEKGTHRISSSKISGCSSLRGIPLNELICHLAFYWWVALFVGKWLDWTNSIRALASTSTHRPPNNESLLITSIINSAQDH